MMGEISPHHEYCDSKSSSETPPSYNQLNYNEKIERFFNSNLLINTNYGTDEENINSTGQNNYGIDKISPNNSSSKCTTQNHDSGGSGSGENFSNESNNKTSTLSGDTSPINGNLYTTKQDKFKLPTLTKTLLTKHNQDMEKLMMLQHKEKRSNIKNNKLNEDARIKNLNDKLTRQKKSTGKKANKRRHNLNNKNDTPGKISKLNDGTKKPEKIESKNTRQFDKLNQVTEMNTNNNSVPANSTSQETLCSVVPSMLPIYYFPVLNIKENHMTMLVAPQPITNQLPTGQFDCPNSIASHAAPVTKLTNPQIIGAPGLASMLFTPSIVIKIPSVQENLENKNEKSAESKGPESQATSIKAQPGSIMATSESSKKILSIGGHISSCVSVEGGCSSIVDQQSSMNTQKKPESSVQDSSDSSFYGRYLDSSSESSSMENHKANLTRLSEEMSNKRGRHFSMINDMKANFELQTNIRPVEATQKLLIERNRLKNKKNKQKIIKMTPPWLEGVNMTPDLIYKYQLTPKPLNNVLEADMIALKNFEQPQLVNEQLEQLYIDLELNKFETRLIIEDSNPSSVSIDQQLDSIYPDTKEELTPQQKSARREMKHATMSMIYEENAPFPTD